MKDPLHQSEVISSPESPQEVEPAFSEAMKGILEKILGRSKSSRIGAPLAITD